MALERNLLQRPNAVTRNTAGVVQMSWKVNTVIDLLFKKGCLILILFKKKLKIPSVHSAILLRQTDKEEHWTDSSEREKHASRSERKTFSHSSLFPGNNI